jgi:hypothetical protein
VQLTSGGVNYGTLQLRWSTACKTIWGKFISNGNVGRIDVSVYREEDGKVCGDQTGGGCSPPEYFSTPNTVYSNQLYSCNYHTLARVDFLDRGIFAETSAVGGC